MISADDSSANAFAPYANSYFPVVILEVGPKNRLQFARDMMQSRLPAAPPVCTTPKMAGNPWLKERCGEYTACAATSAPSRSSRAWPRSSRGARPTSCAGRITSRIGNIATEDLASMLDEMGVETGIDLPRLLEASRAAQEMLGRPLGSHVLRAPGRSSGRGASRVICR